MALKTRSFLLFFSVLLSACTPRLELVSPESGRTLESYEAFGKEAMVVTANPEATDIGLAVLQKGGSAVDAGIAVSFALSVLRPQSTGLGGGGFMLYYNRQTGKTTALDFREFAPFKSNRSRGVNPTLAKVRGRSISPPDNPPPDMYVKEGIVQPELARDGALSVAVPRLVAGLGDIYDHYATQKIEWPELVAPAIRLARGGFAVYPHLAAALKEREAVLSRFKSSKKIFLPKGKPLEEGDILVQADLARTLEKIAGKGWSGFYEGDVATSIVRSVQKAFGIITLSDLLHVEPIETEPIGGTYHGYKIVAMPLPSSGGVTLLETLNILEDFPLAKWGPYNVRTIHVVTEALRRSFLDRARYLADPRFVKVPVRGLIAKDYAKTLAEAIDLQKATPSESLAPKEPLLREQESTTHFTIVDAWGNAVVSTQTINALFGSGLVAEGTGVVLNNEMDDFGMEPGTANAVAPGKKPLSSMAPTLVFDPKGDLVMALGSPGGPKIITAVLQTLLNRIDFEASPLKAVAAKRFHHSWIPDEIQYEEGFFSPKLLDLLGRLGHRPKETKIPWQVMLVAKTRRGWVGVSDPRGTGTARGY